MNLDFIIDILKPGDKVFITTLDNVDIEGEVVKISKDAIAIKDSSGKIIGLRSIDVKAWSSCDKSSELSSNMDEDIESSYLKYPTLGDRRYHVNVDRNKILELIENLSSMVNEYDKFERFDSNAFLACYKKGKVYIRKQERVYAKKDAPRNITFMYSVMDSCVLEPELMKKIKDSKNTEDLNIEVFFHSIPISRSEKKSQESKSVFSGCVFLPNSLFYFENLLFNALANYRYQQAKLLLSLLISKMREMHAYEKAKILIEVSNLLKIISLPPVIRWSLDGSKNTQINNNIKITKDDAPEKRQNKVDQLLKNVSALIQSGEVRKAIEEIDNIIDTTRLESKQLSSLLLQKAQSYSSQREYDNALKTYEQLIALNEEDGRADNTISHLYSELARIQLITGAEKSVVLSTLEKALNRNSDNILAKNLKLKVESDAYTNINEEERREWMLDEERSLSSISKMIDMDIKQHSYVSEEILSNGSIPTATIAKRILDRAKRDRDGDLSDRYPIYLEAAKAFSELPAGSYNTQDYYEAVTYYSILKGNSLYFKFKKLVTENNIAEGDKDIDALTLLSDSACSYYVESLNLYVETLNLISESESESDSKPYNLFIILSNYLNLNLTIYNLKKGNKNVFTRKFNVVFADCNKSADPIHKRIAWDTVLTFGSSSPRAWNVLTKEYWFKIKIVFFLLKRNGKEIYDLINSINIYKTSTSLPPEKFIKSAFSLKKQRLDEFNKAISDVLKQDLNLHQLSSLNDSWKTISSYDDLLLTTDKESNVVAGNILSNLSKYVNRNEAERTNLMIQAQRDLENQITFINDNTTYYGRTFYFPLFTKWLRIIKHKLDDKISRTQPELQAAPDPQYILVDDNDKKRFINVIIKNVGASTAEGYSMNVYIKDANIQEEAKYLYKEEIPAGSSEIIQIIIPEVFKSSDNLEFRVEISALYQGNELAPKQYRFSAEVEPDSPLTEEDILWSDSAIPAENMFKGRQEFIDKLTRYYTSINRDKPYILYGLTRTGKSSILKYLRANLDQKMVTISSKKMMIATFEWDLGIASSYGNAAGLYQYLLKENVYDELNKYVKAEDLKYFKFPENPKLKDFSPLLIYLREQSIYPIFFVDEFSYIKMLMDNSTINAAFLHTMRQCSIESKLASFIYAGTYDIKALIKDEKYGITGQLVNAVEEQISEIDRNSAEDLMRVMGEKLKFTDEAIEHIHNLSGDIPYFIQIICKNCGLYAVEKKRHTIGFPELEQIVQVLTREKKPDGISESLQPLPENTFQNNLYSPSDKKANALLSSIASFNRGVLVNPRGVSINEIQEQWAKCGIEAYRPLIADTITVLKEKKILVQDEDEDLPVYKISVDIFRRWWAVNHPDVTLEISSINS